MEGILFFVLEFESRICANVQRMFFFGFHNVLYTTISTLLSRCFILGTTTEKQFATKADVNLIL